MTRLSIIEASKHLLDRKPAGDGRRLKQGQLQLTEAVVSERDLVMLAGVYDAGQDGIAPDADEIMRPFRLVVGGEAPLKRKVGNRVVGMVIAGALAVVTAVLYFALFVPSTG